MVRFASRSLRHPHPFLLICDIQERFRAAISNFDKVISTAEKVLKFAQIWDIPIYATTQSAARLGPTCSELAALIPEDKTYDKTAFSMMKSEIKRDVNGWGAPLQVALVGIETHICITQTALDLIDAGHTVYVLVDGVSSCNDEERSVALARLAHAGAIITSSESWMYECLGDAKSEEYVGDSILEPGQWSEVFKAVADLVKASKDSTRRAVQALCKI